LSRTKKRKLLLLLPLPMVLKEIVNTWTRQVRMFALPQRKVKQHLPKKDRR
jgi:hypothetical protein